MSKCLVLVALSALMAPVWATSKAITLSVPTMDCPVCPITVKRALAKVPGVSQAEVNFGKRQATVQFDDTRTTVEALTRATKEAGYPSILVTNAQ